LRAAADRHPLYPGPVQSPPGTPCAKHCVHPAGEVRSIVRALAVDSTEYLERTFALLHPTPTGPVSLVHLLTGNPEFLHQPAFALDLGHLELTKLFRRAQER